MGLEVVLTRSRGAPFTEAFGDWCAECRHASPVTNAEGLGVKAEVLRGCSMHERIVIRSGWCEEWEGR